MVVKLVRLTESWTDIPLATCVPLPLALTMMRSPAAAATPSVVE
jgi:hypothetical protein